jgi:low temperature requirement protein LtrA
VTHDATRDEEEAPLEIRSDAAARTSEHSAREVTWLELFYDLVFAAAVITFSDAVSHHPEPEVIAVVTGAFVAVWLVWLATTLYVNAFGIDDTLHRVLVVIQMLLLTLCSLAVGDGLGHNPRLAASSYALLLLDVAVMFGRHARADTAAAPLATLRRTQYSLAAIPIIVALFIPETARAVLWSLAIVAVAVPTLGFRVGARAKTVTVDEFHLMERFGLLTIVVIGEAFVKVSLVVIDGHLDGIDATVLVALFVVVFGIWWSYFDDIPFAGLRDGVGSSVGWLFGHLVFQVAIVGVAVAYAKWLQFDEQHKFTDERSLLATVPFVAVLLALALIGACSRRVPRRPLLLLRLGTALFVIAAAAVYWPAAEADVSTAASALAVIAIVHAALAARFRRATEVLTPSMTV